MKSSEGACVAPSLRLRASSVLTIFKNSSSSFVVQFLAFILTALNFYFAGTTSISRHSLKTLYYTGWGLFSCLWMGFFLFSIVEILVLSARFNERLNQHWRQKMVDASQDFVPESPSNKIGDAPLEQSRVAAESFVEMKKHNDPTLRLMGVEVRNGLLAAMATILGGSIMKALVERNRA
jgi:hypothetical protein